MSIEELKQHINFLFKQQSIVDEIIEMAWFNKKKEQLEQAVDIKLASFDRNIINDIIAEITPTLEKLIVKTIKENLKSKTTK